MSPHLADGNSVYYKNSLEIIENQMHPPEHDGLFFFHSIPLVGSLDDLNIL